MSRKRASKNGTDVQQPPTTQALYQEAFALFTKGYSNQQIEMANPFFSTLPITHLLEPPIEMVLDELERIVTKNVKFHKSTSYFAKRKQFIRDMVLDRTAILHSKDFKPSEKDLINEFINICDFYNRNGSLKGYVYLKLQLVFDKLYYSHKKSEEQGKNLPSATLPKTETIHSTKTVTTPRTAKIEVIAEAVNTPKRIAKHSDKHSDEKKVRLKSPSVAPQRLQSKAADDCAKTPSTINKEDILLELENKKKKIEALRLEHQILLKKSEILSMEAAINEIQNKIVQDPTAPIATQPQKTKRISKNMKSKDNSIPKSAVIYTLISSEEQQQIKAEESASMEEEQRQEDEEAKHSMNDAKSKEDDDQEYVADLEEEERPVRRRRRKSQKHMAKTRDSMPTIKQPNKSHLLTNQLPKKRITDHQLTKSRPQKKEQTSYKQIQTPQQNSEQQKTQKSRRRKKDDVGETKLAVSPQDFESTSWREEQQRFFIEKLQKTNVFNIWRASKALEKQFGQKRRFKTQHIKEARSNMFKACRKKFLVELSKRQMLTAEELRSVSTHINNIDQRSCYDFVNKFIQQFYFSNIDIMLNKAFKDTVVTIATLKLRPALEIRSASSKIEEEPTTANSDRNVPEDVDSPQTGPLKKFKRQMFGLGINQADIDSARKRMGKIKIETKKEPKAEDYSSKRDGIYYEQELDEGQANSGGVQSFGKADSTTPKQAANEKKSTNSVHSNLKFAFQNYIEPLQKVS